MLCGYIFRICMVNYDQITFHDHVKSNGIWVGSSALRAVPALGGGKHGICHGSILKLTKFSDKKGPYLCLFRSKILCLSNCNT